MTWIIIISLILLFSIVVLPLAGKSIINNLLQKLDGYTGKIDNLQIHLITGEIILQNLRINKRETEERNNPLALFPKITVTFKWKPLLDKILDLHIIVEKPQLHLIAETSLGSGESSSSSKELPNLKAAIEKLMAFRISLEIQAGEIHYIHSSSHPSLDIKASELNLTMHDFSNRASITKSCKIVGKCAIYEGNAAIDVTLLPLEPTLTADLNLELNSINLVLLNDVFRSYAKVDIHKGTLNLYSEVAIGNNSFKGYIKPLLKDLDFISSADHTDNIFHRIWERTVAGFYNLIENSNNRVATKIPIEGRLDDPKIRLGVAILGILRNAFFKAFTPSFDNVISLKSIWNIMSKR